jgi:catechol 2,3-dioxygenase-like lactoylglutathione lyase family enzyme
MIHGAHLVLYSADPEADRAFLRDALGLRSVDAGHGWLIFALPPAEAALHPAEEAAGATGGGDLLSAHLYLMCDDLPATIAELAGKGVACGEVDRQRWGSRTTIRLPSGGAIGLYQPAHPTALGLAPD